MEEVRFWICFLPVLGNLRVDRTGSYNEAAMKETANIVQARPWSCRGVGLVELTSF